MRKKSDFTEKLDVSRGHDNATVKRPFTVGVSQEQIDSDSIFATTPPYNTVRSRKKATGAPYGIIDPEYARFYTKARCTAWQYGYALMMHGSFTRDLDLLAVPWQDNACPPDHLIKMICWRTGLETNGHPPTGKPHGRIAFTLIFKTPEDPRFVDISVMPRLERTKP